MMVGSESEIDIMSNDRRVFIIVFVTESSVGEPGANLSYQECFSLIKAPSLEEAKQKAVDYANNDNTSYANVYGETVTWVVKQIIDITETLEDKFDLHTDAVDLYVRGFDDYEAYQSLFDVTQN